MPIKAKKRRIFVPNTDMRRKLLTSVSKNCADKEPENNTKDNTINGVQQILSCAPFELIKLGV